ncbi:MAG: hypothetical protein ABIP03_07060 [Aquihabitans sp.]
MTTADPVADAVGFPAPGTPSPTQAPVGATGQPTTTRTLSWIGLAVAAVGTVQAALSVTVLNWASDTSFSDLRKVSDTFESSSYDDAVVAYHYGAWGWPLFLLLVVAGLVLVATFISRGDGTILRLMVAGIAASGRSSTRGVPTGESHRIIAGGTTEVPGLSPYLQISADPTNPTGSIVSYFSYD